MKNIISISHLDLSINNKSILQDINLSIQEGQSLAIIGGSGAGKSILAKAIIGFLQYNNGLIEINGKKVIYPAQDNVKLHNIGMVFQQNALFDSLPIWENISFGLLQQKLINRIQAKQLVLEKLKTVGLTEKVIDKFPNELSGGMQKRVAILRTIILEPKIIIFDEPTSGLDPINSNLIANLIASLNNNITKIIITHDMNIVKVIASHVVMLQQGKVVWYGSARELHCSNNQYVKEFIIK